jgi:hypothetical protein
MPPIFIDTSAVTIEPFRPLGFIPSGDLRVVEIAQIGVCKSVASRPCGRAQDRYIN